MMRCKIIYLLVGIICCTWIALGPLSHKKVLNPAITHKKVTFRKTAAKKVVIEPLAKKRSVIKPKVLKTVATRNSTLKQISFEDLPGWDATDLKKSLSAFKTSCKTFIKLAPTHAVGSALIHLKAKDWQPACKEALPIAAIDENKAKEFFEKWFYPIELRQKKPINGLFTGYYMPELNGNLTRTDKYSTPIYGLPSNLDWRGGKHAHHKKKVSVNYTREEIDNGVLRKKAPVIAWINSPIERLFLEIEGSGVIKLTGGKNLYLGYAGENGKRYSSIGSVLIKKGVLTKNTASKAAIKRYLEHQPHQAKSILHKNKSFVFFQKVKHMMGLGAQGQALTPGYSLAIDKKFIPLGAPLWLATTIPDKKHKTDKQFQRLMVAQDTGGAIKGIMRGDIYWGSGKKATFLGEHMKNKGRYWLFLPKPAFDRL